MLNLNDKVCIITGAGSGIGRATAIQCCSLGAKLCLVDLNEDKLKETVNLCCRGGNTDKGCQTQQGDQNNIITVIGDLTDINVLKRVVDECIRKFNRLNILINNAATFQWKSNLMQTDMNDFQRVMDLNVKSVVSLTQLCVPHLIKTQGCIINVSSASAKCCVGALAYSMSKGALDQFTKCVALELAEHGVRVNSVNPGHVANTGIMHPQQQTGSEGTTTQRQQQQTSTTTTDRQQQQRTEQCRTEQTRMNEQQQQQGRQQTTRSSEGCNIERGCSDEQLKMHHENIGKQYPMGRIGTVDEIANAIVFLASDNSGWTTGQLLNVDGGLSRSCCLRLQGM